MKTKKIRTGSKEYNQVREKVNDKIGFYIHLSVYILVNLFFHIRNLMEGGEYWAFFPLVFWGAGLCIHFLNVFDLLGTTEWKRRQILKQIEKQRLKKEGK